MSVVAGELEELGTGSVDVDEAVEQGEDVNEAAEGCARRDEEEVELVQPVCGCGDRAVWVGAFLGDPPLEEGLPDDREGADVEVGEEIADGVGNLEIEVSLGGIV